MVLNLLMFQLLFGKLPVMMISFKTNVINGSVILITTFNVIRKLAIHIDQ